MEKKYFPFTEDAAAGIAALGEIKIIERIRDAFDKISPPAPRGIGDDCAVLPAVPESFPAQTVGTPKRLVTTDSVIFSKHFDESVSPEDAGKKLIRRNVSDIAAM
ncbi:MAG: thiamine-monophosphate kinase, partial [Opitutales bacterium]|nr:thiamine-monophosphate kinase [Opitutales bacterium]